MKPISQTLAEIKEAGLIYDPYVTAGIISYEAGNLLRSMFYASLVDLSKGKAEEQELQAHYNNAQVEAGDLLIQLRIFYEVMGWDYETMMNIADAKLQERIKSYKDRGVRPNQTLMANLSRTMGRNFGSAPSRVPIPARKRFRDGD